MTLLIPVSKGKAKVSLDSAIIKCVSSFWCFKTYTDNLLISTLNVII